MHSEACGDHACSRQEDFDRFCCRSRVFRFRSSEARIMPALVNFGGVISAADLMGCDVQDLMLALSTCSILAGNDNTVQKLTSPQAIDTRDALVKYIYTSLFDWFVEQLNNSLEVGKRQSGRSISDLDIYGFESCDVCISCRAIESITFKY